MKILDTLFQKLGQGMDHIGSTLDRIGATTVTYDSATYKPPATPVAAPAAPASIQVDNILAALAHNETRGVSGDPYNFVQPSGSTSLGKAMGKYQTTEGEIKTWAKQFLGHDIDSKDFAATPALQDEYTRKKVEAMIEAGASTEEIIAMHRGGLSGYADPKVRQRKLKERKRYVDNALEYLNSL